METVTVPIKGLNVAGCAHELEKSLGKREAIRRVEASYAMQTATITYDETKLSEAQLAALVQTCGFDCTMPMMESNMQATLPSKGDGQQPITVTQPMAGMDMSTPDTRKPEVASDSN